MHYENILLALLQESLLEKNQPESADAGQEITDAARGFTQCAEAAEVTM